MQLSLHADYALRALIYLGAHPARVVPTHEISSAYGISKHHLVRVMQTLAEHGYVEISPGRLGGAKLSRSPQEIRLGDIFRIAEPHLRLAECFDRQTNTCPIAPVCALKGMLNEALEAFVAALNRHTIAEILAHGRDRQVAQLLTILAG